MRDMHKSGTCRFDGTERLHAAQKRRGFAADLVQKRVSLAAKQGWEHSLSKSRELETRRYDLILPFTSAQGLERDTSKLETSDGHNLKASCRYFMILENYMPHSLR